MSGILDIVYAEYNYWIYVTLMMIGFYAMIAKKNPSMSRLQTSLAEPRRFSWAGTAEST